MNGKQAHLDWVLGLKWLASCVLGAVVFGTVAFWLRWRLGEAAVDLEIVSYGSLWRLGEAVGQRTEQTDYEFIGVFVVGALFGALLALGGTLGPGLLLRRIGISAVHWTGYSVAVAALAMSIGTSLIAGLNIALITATVSALFLGLVLGLPAGLVQRWLLEQRGISATLWPLVNTVAYLFGMAIVVFFSATIPTWITLIGIGLVLGSISGVGIAWLLRHVAEFPANSGHPAHDSGTPGAVR